ncbi:protein rolling stone [Lingula anatina]|uniref:Protein rolling stone n=1 Tax=Lingula anatina TaxID=7574 RepID=A0A1S3JD38_LINAN|nr:protein rolling stone [Lingula anatina]|eukprot:XP_013408086.1 protein rolling stone [Lingula anatina]
MSIRQELRCANFGLNYFREDVFYLPQWNWPPMVFIIYRVVMALYCMVWVIYAASISPTANLKEPWWAWLTNWSYIVLTCHMVLAAAISLWHTPKRCSRNNIGIEAGGGNSKDTAQQDHTYYTNPAVSADAAIDTTTDTTTSASLGHGASSGTNLVDTENGAKETSASIRWYMKLDWLLWTVASVCAIIVSLVIMVFAYPVLKGIPTPVDFQVHVANTILVLIDTIVAGYPVRILHVVYVHAYGCVYVVFSVIYWAVDHTNVMYPVLLDWNGPGYTFISLGVVFLIVMPLLQLIYYGIFRLKLYCLKRSPAPSGEVPL